MDFSNKRKRNYNQLQLLIDFGVLIFLDRTNTQEVTPAKSMLCTGTKKREEERGSSVYRH